MKRLADPPELARALDAVREESISEARIEASRAAVHAKIAAGGGATIGALIAKIALLVVGGGAVIVLAVNGTPPRPAPEREPAEVTVEALVPEISAPIMLDAPTTTPPTPTPTLVPPLSPAATPAPVTPARARVLPARTEQAPPVPEAIAAKTGTLHLQIAAFEAARASAQSGRDAEAIDALERLERDHPRTPLLPEVRLARAESHARLGHIAAALADLEKAIDDPALAARRPELLRFAEDLRSRR